MKWIFSLFLKVFAGVTFLFIFSYLLFTGIFVALSAGIWTFILGTFMSIFGLSGIIAFAIYLCKKSDER